MNLIRRSAIFTLTAFALASGALACSSNSGLANNPTDGGVDAMGEEVVVQDASVPFDAPSDANEAGNDSARGAPSLTALSVTGAERDGEAPDATASIALVPSFAPDVYDYYVRCAAGTNALNVSMTASSGANSLLVQPTPSASLPSQTLPVSVTGNQAIVAAATDGTATTEYWVRCLPPDFPQIQMNLHPDAGAPPAGYYLVGNIVPNPAAYAIVLNGNGVPVWYQRTANGQGAVDVDNIVSGTISYDPAAATTNVGFDLYELSAASVTTLAPAGYTPDEHELQVLPNGNYLVFSYPLTSGVDLTGLSIASVDGGSPVALGPNSIIQDCAIVEFQPSGTVVNTWLASNHFNAAQVSMLPLTGFGGVTAPDGGPVYDVFHCNSIDIDPTNGNLLVSAREMNSVFYVEWPGGTVLWKMGGANSSLDNAAYVSVADPFFYQHDARLQPGWSPTCNGGSGQVSLFDDESGEPGPARGVVYDVAVGGGDGGTNGCDGGASADGGPDAGQATVVWQYKGSTTTEATGSFRISADGSRVIGWGLGGVPGLAFTEVDINGNDLLDFHFTDFSETYRAIKVPLTAFDLSVLRSTAGGPL